MMLLRRWRRGRSSVSGVTVSLAASWDTPMRCAREEQILLLPSILQPLSPAATRQFLLAGPDSPMGWWRRRWWCAAMQCRCRCNVLASAVDEESCVCLCVCLSGNPTPMLQVRFVVIYEQ